VASWPANEYSDSWSGVGGSPRLACNDPDLLLLIAGTGGLVAEGVGCKLRDRGFTGGGTIAMKKHMKTENLRYITKTTIQHSVKPKNIPKLVNSHRTKTNEMV